LSFNRSLWQEVVEAWLKALPQLLTGETVKNHENFIQDSRYPGRDFNSEPPEYETRAPTTL
jgi:hypothetical protein